jgi:PEP-CTERM motif
MNVRSKLSYVFGFTFLAWSSSAAAVTYEYIRAPLTSEVGTTLSGHPIIFEFSTYNLLPANLSYNQSGLIGPDFSVPIINWSVSVGQYQATGIGNASANVAQSGNTFVATGSNGMFFLMFDTNSIGQITGSSFLVNPVTTDGGDLISVREETPGIMQVIDAGGALQSAVVQVNPNELDANFTDLASAETPGSWILLDSTPIAEDSTPIAEAVPEPSTWAMLLIGFAGMGAISYRRRRDAQEKIGPINSPSFHL